MKITYKGLKKEKFSSSSHPWSFPILLSQTFLICLSTLSGFIMNYLKRITCVAVIFYKVSLILFYKKCTCCPASISRLTHSLSKVSTAGRIFKSSLFWVDLTALDDGVDLRCSSIPSVPSRDPAILSLRKQINKYFLRIRHRPNYNWQCKNHDLRQWTFVFAAWIVRCGW